MKFKPGPVKQPTLSDPEKAALQGIAAGAIVGPLLCQRLKALGLVVQTMDGWSVTQQGYIQLMFQYAS
jgi:hypothetical protein